MLDFNLPIKIFNRNEGYPSFFVKEVLFHNKEYALLKIDMDEKDLAFAGEHGDIVIVALPDETSGYYDGYTVISKYFDNHKAKNARKMKIEAKLEYSELINNKIINISEKQNLLSEVVKELGYPNINVLIKRNLNYTVEGIELIRKYEDIGYIYESDDFDDYINVTDNFIARNHNQIFPICEYFKDIDLYRQAYRDTSRSIVRISKFKEKKEIEITDAWGQNSLFITEGMSLNKKDNKSPAVNYIQNYNEFKKLLVSLNNTLYSKDDALDSGSEW